MHAHAAEIVAKSRFEGLAREIRQRLPGGKDWMVGG
jgi:hypothetical protein